MSNGFPMQGPIGTGVPMQGPIGTDVPMSRGFPMQGPMGGQMQEQMPPTGSFGPGVLMQGPGINLIPIEGPFRQGSAGFPNHSVPMQGRTGMNVGPVWDPVGPVWDPAGLVRDPLNKNIAGMGVSSRCIMCGGPTQMQQEKCMACFLEFLA